MFGKIANKVAGIARKGVDLVKRHSKKIIAGVVAVGTAAKATVASAVDVYADPTTIETTASTAFVTVSGFVVAVVGFYIVVRIVRGIKGR